MDRQLRSPPSGLVLPELVVVTVILQLPVCLIAAAVLDGGRCLQACSCGIALHWVCLGLLDRPARRSRLGRVFMAAGWVPLVAAALWFWPIIRP